MLKFKNSKGEKLWKKWWEAKSSVNGLGLNILHKQWEDIWKSSLKIPEGFRVVHLAQPHDLNYFKSSKV